MGNLLRHVQCLRLTLPLPGFFEELTVQYRPPFQLIKHEFSRFLRRLFVRAQAESVGRSGVGSGLSTGS